MNILIVDDDANIRDSLTHVVQKKGHNACSCSSGEEAVEKGKNDIYDMAFLDVKMPGMGGMKALEMLSACSPQMKIFMISGEADIATAVRATKLGACDFLEKPLNPDKVGLEIDRIIEQQRLDEELARLKHLVDLDRDMVGKSSAMQRLCQEIDRAAPTDSRILIFGPNGSGKEMVAREIHKKSLRSKGTFIQLNCAAIPRELIESELFGYEKGAFTGAHKRKLGLIEQAQGGTLLLDEVGDMAYETQAKLLRVLQESEFSRVGGSKPQKFDVRIISATNKDLADEIARGHFREDLYFRLNVIPIRVPSLAERKEDIPLMVNHFLKTYSIKNGKSAKKINQDAIPVLQSYHWPGNVRELKNVMERLAIMTMRDLIRREDVESVLGIADHSSNKPSFVDALPEANVPLKEQLTGFERRILTKAHVEFQGNVSKMSQVLKTDRANLHKKLKKYGIK
jgi:two-component system nitrogen regulation response regulator NtrX